jgi:iron(III) transport system substrate-binding protein
VSRRPIALLAALALASGAGAGADGCGGARAGDSIVLYNGQHPQLTDALVAAFEKQTGIDIRVRTNDGIVLADQILQEGSASQADVYLTENSPELAALHEHGLLARVNRSTLNQVPKSDNGPGGDWVGIALRVSALAYDPALVSPTSLPSSILQLAQPQWKGKVGIAPTDSDFPPLVGALLATYGKAATASWLAGLKRGAQIYQTEEAVVAAVNRGDLATGIVNNYYWFRLRLELGQGSMHSTLYYFPNRDVGSLENLSGAAVLASSAQPRAAQALLSFLVSKPAQQIIAHGDDFEYPTRAGVKPNAALSPLSSIAPATLGPSALGDDQQAAHLIQESGLA